MRRTHPFRNRRPPTQILRAGKSTRENPRRLSGSTHRHRAHKGSADPRLSVVTSLIATSVAAVNERQPTMRRINAPRHRKACLPPLFSFQEKTSRKGLRNLRSGDQSVMANATLENAPRNSFSSALRKSNRRALRIIAEGTAPMRTKSVRHHLASVHLPLTSPVVSY